MRKFYLGIAAALLCVIPASAQNYTKVELQVVVFRADWCSPCRILEPNLDNALRAMNDPAIRLVPLDTTNGATFEVANVAFDANVVPQYNTWAGITGFAAIVDPDTQRTLGCINQSYDPGAIAQHLQGLKQIAMRDGENFDLTCPAPNR